MVTFFTWRLVGSVGVVKRMPLPRNIHYQTSFHSVFPLSVVQKWKMIFFGKFRELVHVCGDHDLGREGFHCTLFTVWSSGQSFWLQIQRSRVRSPALPDFLSSSGCGTGSTQPREPREVN